MRLRDAGRAPVAGSKRLAQNDQQFSLYLLSNAQYHSSPNRTDIGLDVTGTTEVATVPLVASGIPAWLGNGTALGVKGLF